MYTTCLPKSEEGVGVRPMSCTTTTPLKKLTETAIDAITRGFYCSNTLGPVIRTGEETLVSAH